MGHTKERAEFINTDTEEWFDRNNYDFSVERIQARKLSRVGWLLGSHPGVLNVKNLQDALDQIHPFSRIQTEVRIEKVNYKDSENVKAAMIFIAHKRAAKARAALKKMYTMKNKEGFPLGLQARFVPYAGDSRFLKTFRMEESIKSLETKQKLFVNNTLTDVCEVINDLDYI